MIQTKVRVRIDSGLKRDIEPKAMTRPSGIAPISVTAKSLRVCTKPTFREWKTMGNCWANTATHPNDQNTAEKPPLRGGKRKGVRFSCERRTPFLNLCEVSYWAMTEPVSP